MEVKIDIDTSQLDREFDRIEQRIDNGVRFVALAHEAEAVKGVAKDSGSTQSSISVQRKGQASYSVEANAMKDGAPIAAFQEFGTGLYAEDWDGHPLPDRHRIYPRRQGGRLQFTWQGKEWNLPSVAGTKPTHFMRKAWEAIERRVNEIFARGFNALK